MYEIPTFIQSDGRKYKIRNDGDFRTILDCFQALSDVELDSNERLVASLLIFYEDFNSVEDLYNVDIQELVKEMYNFFNCGQYSTGTESNHKLVDWKADSQLICSAINKVAGFEIRSVKYLHWWTFMGYYMAIGESPISTIIGIRDKIVRGKKLEKFENEYRRNNPQFFVWNNKTVDEYEAEMLVKELWNSGG